MSIRELLDAMPTPPLPEPYLSSGWVYKDIHAWFLPDDWNHLIDLFGTDDDFKCLAFTSRGGKRRGQFWLSPGALERSRAFIAKAQGDQ